jgi:hypothetical protein
MTIRIHHGLLKTGPPHSLSNLLRSDPAGREQCLLKLLAKYPFLCLWRIFPCFCDDPELLSSECPQPNSEGADLLFAQVSPSGRCNYLDGVWICSVGVFNRLFGSGWSRFENGDPQIPEQRNERNAQADTLVDMGGHRSVVAQGTERLCPNCYPHPSEFSQADAESREWARLCYEWARPSLDIHDTPSPQAEDLERDRVNNPKNQ